MNCIPASDLGLTAEALRVGCRTEPVWIRCVHLQCTASIFYVRRNLSLMHLLGLSEQCSALPELMYVVYIGSHKDTQLEQTSPNMSDIKGERLHVVES